MERVNKYTALYFTFNLDSINLSNWVGYMKNPGRYVHWAPSLSVFHVAADNFLHEKSAQEPLITLRRGHVWWGQLLYAQVVPFPQGEDVEQVSNNVYVGSMYHSRDQDPELSSTTL